MTSPPAPDTTPTTEAGRELLDAGLLDGIPGVWRVQHGSPKAVSVAIVAIENEARRQERERVVEQIRGAAFVATDKGALSLPLEVIYDILDEVGRDTEDGDE